jgi:hypothetical protein
MSGYWEKLNLKYTDCQCLYICIQITTWGKKEVDFLLVSWIKKIYRQDETQPSLLSQYPDMILGRFYVTWVGLLTWFSESTRSWTQKLKWWIFPYHKHHKINAILLKLSASQLEKPISSFQNRFEKPCPTQLTVSQIIQSTHHKEREAWNTKDSQVKAVMDPLVLKMLRIDHLWFLVCVWLCISCWNPTFTATKFWRTCLAQIIKRMLL